MCYVCSTVMCGLYSTDQVYRVYANNQEFESIRLSDTLQFMEDGKVGVLYQINQDHSLHGFNSLQCYPLDLSLGSWEIVGYELSSQMSELQAQKVISSLVYSAVRMGVMYTYYGCKRKNDFNVYYYTNCIVSKHG